MADTEPTSSSKRKIDIEEIEVDVTAPEPPSKRARRALKKGKALPAKQDSDDERKGDKEGKDKKDATRSEHGVWIGNLPFYLTSVDLRKWLVDNSGEVISDEMITRVKLPTTKEPGRDKNAKPTNKGFAYVDFTDIGPKVAAIALSETEIGGRKLLIKDAKSFEGRPKKEPEAAADEDTPEGKAQAAKEQKKEVNASRKIFVGNMGFKTTDDDLRRNFEKCGEIEWVKVATFEDTGKCKGFGWVKFSEPEAAAWAVKGFVKIKEEVETEEDFKDDEDRDEDRKKQYKMRKWWVNRMLGRELKIELAEDDQARYKKRFGKDRKANDNNSNPRGRPPPRRYDQADSEAKSEGGVKPLKEAEDINVARLTGAVVKHTGTKMTFD
ncbi:uncharacterized protein NECHADRAFT_40832 [Fusarium vanettenii 77-13-4]|uniref:RRM domain-containing protein n=1 Tax=Fusarium vanettenii (strain ATCC MYA-4622 / CBS 123669 / FGSC 9596 / NRRL 45880 / 77-13-4) TaxID=660122 RepID=C7YRR6_FUSV7|nr:uncharacterized protein NECHADRAFT_40832 [Fusarium vanettenii 77-13-4]EEU45119.1 hypothetical protein NECHADRAFT_40832 [Fusarium vanettenii 77-13-4]